ncbi:MAG: diiron oxygenase [Pseudonocardiaceae bacterium]
MNMNQDFRDIPYPDIFGKWDSKASVRATPRRAIEAAQTPTKSFFPRSLMPVCDHHLVTRLPDAVIEEILTQRLYCYLDATTVLEQNVVNPVLLEIAHDGLAVEFASDMRFDAHKIYCDEAYHALFSADLKKQIVTATGVWPIAAPEPSFMHRLRLSHDAVPAELRGLASLCFAVVSETLISALLSHIPADPTVVDSVRLTVADHARDERYHHAYFSKILPFVWPQLRRHERKVLGPLFADYIISFLGPDYPMLQAILQPHLQDRDAVTEVLHDCHDHLDVVRDIRQASHTTVRLLAKAGVLDDALTAQTFTDAGLLPDNELIGGLEKSGPNEGQRNGQLWTPPRKMAESSRSG